MALDVGDLIPGLGVTTTSNATGALADPTTLTLTLTLPDGTSRVGTYPAAPGDTLTIVRASTGVYSCTHVTTLEGRHAARWVASGGGADGALEEAWGVGGPGVGALVSLEELRAHLVVSQSASDEALRTIGLVASEAAESYTGRTWRAQSLVEAHDRGRAFIELRARPVAAVASVVESGTAVTSGGYVLDATSGILWRGTTAGADRWAPGLRSIVVTYTAGGTPPAAVRHAVLELARHLWDTQRGGAGLPRQQGAGDDWDPRAGYSIPRRVAELLDPQRVPLVG